jgi:hypothetical protein
MTITYVVLSLAELVTTFVNAAMGAGIHALLLILLLVHAATISKGVGYPILVSLLMAPLIRLLSLALPLFLVPQGYWYFTVSVPLFAAAFVSMRLLRYSLRDVGFNLNALPYQLITALLGISFGYIEFLILRPEPLIKQVSLTNLFIASVSLLIGTGLMWGYVFYRTRSIFGITLSHTLTNIMLFILLPLAMPKDLRLWCGGKTGRPNKRV